MDEEDRRAALSPDQNRFQLPPARERCGVKLLVVPPQGLLQCRQGLCLFDGGLHTLAHLELLQAPGSEGVQYQPDEYVVHVVPASLVGAARKCCSSDNILFAKAEVMGKFWEISG